MRKMVIDEAEGIKEKVKKDIAGKFVYLKFDCATWIRTNYLAINVRYLDTNGPVTKTLAVIDTRSRHSSAAIKQMVDETIDRFDIKPNHVICAITDNAANMVKAVRLMSLEVKAADEAGEEEEDEGQEDGDFDEGTLDLGVLVPHRVEHMRCAVHILQLTVQDSLKDRNINNVISKVRAVAVEARTPIIEEELRSMAGKGAVLSADTRWGSQYVMIQRLIDLQEYIKRISRLGKRP